MECNCSLLKFSWSVFNLWLSKFFTHVTSSLIGSDLAQPWVEKHTMDMVWEKFQWILALYMKPISFQSKVSVVCSVTAAVFIDFCLKKLNVFSQHIGKKANEYLNSTEQIPRPYQPLSAPYHCCLYKHRRLDERQPPQTSWPVPICTWT